MNQNVLPARLALDADLAAVGLDDLPGDVEPEPGAAGARARARGRTARRSARWCSGGMPWPVSLTSKRTPSPSARARDVTRPPGGVWRMRVGEQVGEHQLEPLADRPPRRARTGGSVERELDAPRRAPPLRRLDRRRDQRAPGRPARASSSIRPAWMRDEIEQVVDDPLQPLAVLARRVEQVGLLLGERPGGLLEAQVDGHAQRGERRAELVRHGGDQVVLQLVEAAQARHVLEHHGRRPATPPSSRVERVARGRR